MWAIVVAPLICLAVALLLLMAVVLGVERVRHRRRVATVTHRHDREGQP